MERHLFVYGTLRRPARIPIARALHSNSVFIGPAKVGAKKYRIGRYMAMVLSKKAFVDGEIFRIRDPKRLFALLDQYEGADYRRIIVKASTDSGKFIRCWAYLYSLGVRR